MSMKKDGFKKKKNGRSVQSAILSSAPVSTDSRYGKNAFCSVLGGNNILFHCSALFTVLC